MAAVVLAVVAGPLEHVAAAQPPAGAEAEDAPAAVLGLDAGDSQHGEALTDALRRAFARRGLSGGAETTLVQLRQSLGCSGDEPSCLRGGGSMLGARRLIYGQLGSDGAGAWTLELAVLEVETERVTATSSVLGPDDLEAGSIDATAERLAAALVPEVAASPVDVAPAGAAPSLVRAPPPPPPPPPDAAARPLADDEPASRKRGLVRPRPTPVWKWVGLGTSAGLFAVSLGSTIGMGVWLVGRNGFRADLLEAADNSLTDDNALNDVDPNQSGDICAAAAASPVDDDGMSLGWGGEITNATIFEVCRRARYVRYGQLFAAGVAAVSGVSTVVFTTLLFVRPRRSKGASAWRRHRLHLGVDPTRRGLALQLGGRF
ncbi:MAG: hypothetical protein AB1Z98_03225 [Nannocystaceae bacterium]